MTDLDLKNLLFEELGYSETPDLLQPYNPDNQLINPLPDIEQVYYIQNTPIVYFCRLEKADPERLLQLHRSVWSESKVPLLYVILPQEIRVYNTYTSPSQNAVDLDNQERLLQHLDNLVEIETARQKIRTIVDNSQNSYNRLYLETGAFWDTTDGRKVKRKNRADQHLLDSIMGACRYLIDRKVDAELAKNVFHM